MVAVRHSELENYFEKNIQFNKHIFNLANIYSIAQICFHDILSIIDSESNEVLSYTLEEGSEGMSESFTVEGTGCALLGDVNEDGTVNVIDIVSIVNGILGTDTEDLMLCGDYNEDGQLNVIDIVGIVNAILGS